MLPVDFKKQPCRICLLVKGPYLDVSIIPTRLTLRSHSAKSVQLRRRRLPDFRRDPVLSNTAGTRRKTHIIVVYSAMNPDKMGMG